MSVPDFRSIPLGHSEDFFAGLNIEQITKAQGVDPAFDLRTLTNAWPENEDIDKFLAAIEEGDSSTAR